jgi:hypothetical protein
MILVGEGLPFMPAAVISNASHDDLGAVRIIPVPMGVCAWT